MFNKDFYPTPTEVIDQMLYGYDVSNKICLEPSAGKGNIVDYLKQHEAKSVIACEKNQDLKAIVQNKCKVIADDFLTVKSEDVSHIDFIIMNPPFSADEDHILHAFDIAPDGCTIISLCNYETLRHPYTKKRIQIRALKRDYGYMQNLGSCFDDAERETSIEIGLLILEKPSIGNDNEFEGFFMEEEPEEAQQNGIMPYNAVRDLVNRYISAIKLFEEQTELGVKMNDLISTFYRSSKIAFSCKKGEEPVLKEDFKKELQKNAWSWVFNKMNMEKYTTKGLKEDINKFVERQQNIPFTMRNIYHMINVIVGTTASRMDRAIIEVFEWLTKHTHENRYYVEGWKTNSHYLINEKFILGSVANVGWSGQVEIEYRWNGERIEDLIKAMCFITGKDYNKILSIRTFVNYPYKLKKDGNILTGHNNIDNTEEKIKRRQEELAKLGTKTEIYHTPIEFGKWVSYEFFYFKCYKKGTMHLKFKDRNVWALLNQHIARILGYPLPEAMKPKQAA